MASEALYRRTPLIESSALSKLAGCRILLKLENLQPSGSFKSRGIGHYINTYLQTHRNSNPNPHFYSSSGGNAGLACVVAATHLGYESSVVVPLSTKERMIEKIKLGGAKAVIQVGKSWREADEFLREEVLRRDAQGVYVPPFDHGDVWTGNSTLVDEVVEQLGEVQRKVGSGAEEPCRDSGGLEKMGNGHLEVLPSAIVCSVGGGGLFCGIMQGLERVHGGVKTQVIAVETEGAASLFRSMEAREWFTLDGITTAATSLGATRVAEQAFKYGLKSNVHGVIMDDVDAAEGCLIMAENERIMLELACGVNVAMCKKENLEMALGREVRREEIVVIVVCGGSNVTVEMMAEWKRDVDERKKQGGDGSLQVVHNVAR